MDERLINLMTDFTETNHYQDETGKEVEDIELGEEPEEDED